MRKAVCSVAVLIAMAASGPAFAQTGYPPTTGPGPDVDVRHYGTVRPGGGFQKADCGFAPGSSAAVAFNGAPAGTAAAAADGCVRLDVGVLDRDTVSIEGRHYGTQCGRQVITVAGTAASGGARVAQNTFAIPCVEVARSDAGLSDTGANVGRWLTVALVLIALGAVLVVADRRRGRATGAS